MELLQLQYFQVIARTQNISAAADELHISQPSLSRLARPGALAPTGHLKLDCPWRRGFGLSE